MMSSHRTELEALEETEEAPESTTEAAEEDPDQTEGPAGQTEGPAGQTEGPGGLLAPILIINNSSAPQYIVVPSLGLLSANQPNQQVPQHFFWTFLAFKYVVDDTRQFLPLLSTRYNAKLSTQKRSITTAFSCCRGASKLLNRCIVAFTIFRGIPQFATIKKSCVLVKLSNLSMRIAQASLTIKGPSLEFFLK
jgi:hypothetical protein